MSKKTEQIALNVLFLAVFFLALGAVGKMEDAYLNRKSKKEKEEDK